jgi:hypothetical protein
VLFQQLSCSLSAVSLGGGDSRVSPTDFASSLQGAAKQLAQVTSEAANDAAQMRSSWHEQVSALEAQIQQLQADSNACEGVAAPVSHSSSSATITTLEDRVAQLEAANAALEQAVLDSHARLSASGRDEQHASQKDIELQDALTALQDRDAEISKVTAELQLLQAQASARPVRGLNASPVVRWGLAAMMLEMRSHSLILDAQEWLGDTLISLSDPVQKLTEILAGKESMIAANQTRIERLESLHRLAQDSAMKCEAELLSSHEALARTQLDNQQLTVEVERSR